MGGQKAAETGALPDGNIPQGHAAPPVYHRLETLSSFFGQAIHKLGEKGRAYQWENMWEFHWF